MRDQPRERLDHTPDRARDAGGDGFGRARAGARPRRSDRKRHAGGGGARSRGGTILSRRRGGVMLRVANLDVFYGDVQALNGVSLDIQHAPTLPTARPNTSPTTPPT